LTEVQNSDAAAGGRVRQICALSIWWSSCLAQFALAAVIEQLWLLLPAVINRSQTLYCQKVEIIHKSAEIAALAVRNCASAAASSRAMAIAASVSSASIAAVADENYRLLKFMFQFRTNMLFKH